MQHHLIAKIKAQKAYSSVGWALPHHLVVEKVQDVSISTCPVHQYYTFVKCQSVEQAVSNPDYNDPLIETLFDIVDLDSDGHISQQEHRLFFSVFDLDAEKSDFVFSKLDIDKDGILSKKEFVSAKKEFLTEKEPGAVGNWFWGSVE
ncbi:hypothetical protein NUACC21_52230 [Scytonema sp. NUACC21]